MQVVETICEQYHMLSTVSCMKVIQGSHAPGKSWIFWVQFPGPGKSWKMGLVLESPGNLSARLESPGIF